jgi:hypothetical protein
LINVDMLAPQSLVDGERLLAQVYTFLAEPPDAKILLENTPSPSPVTVLPAEDDPAFRRVRVALQEGVLGKVWIVIRYARPLRNEPPTDAWSDTTLPWLVPDFDEKTVTTSASTTITVHSTDQIRLEVNDPNWTLISEQGNVAQLNATNSAMPPSVAMRMRRRTENIAVSTDIQQAWIQTWLTRTDRRDRFVMSLSAQDPRMKIQLPPGVALSKRDVVVAVDGRTVTEFNLDDSGLLSFESPFSARTEHVVEIWYEFREGRPPAGNLDLRPPNVMGTDRVQRVFWQVILPRDEHLLWTTSDVTADQKWQWQGWYWSRQANLQQRDLEDWIEASRQDPVPHNTNQYLFTSFRFPDRLVLVTAHRTVLVFAVAGAVLAAGLGLFYLPALRHPALVMGLGVGLAAVAFVVPESALMAAQAAVLGISLVIVGRLVRWAVGSRSAAVQVRGRSISATDSRSFEAPLSIREGSSKANTMPVRTSVSAPATESRT